MNHTQFLRNDFVMLILYSISSAVVLLLRILAGEDEMHLAIFFTVASFCTICTGLGAAVKANQIQMRIVKQFVFYMGR